MISSGLEETRPHWAGDADLELVGDVDQADAHRDAAPPSGAMPAPRKQKPRVFLERADARAVARSAGIMTGMDLADFLLARIAEDEAEVRTGDPGWVPDNELPPGWYFDRVLAECEAKRRIVTERILLMDAATDEQVGAALDREAVLSLIALPYADHPDYREEWRP